MPNWCDNTVTITGTQEKIAEIEKAVDAYDEKCTQGGVGFLAYCLPEPDYETTAVAATYPQVIANYASSEEEKQKALENKPTIRKDSWWDWRVQNWGTKWEVDAERIPLPLENALSITLCFSSAWSPPLEAYSALLSQEGITSISALYYEPSMDFAGKYKDGEVDRIQISLLSRSVFGSDDTVGELAEAFEIYRDIMQSNPLQLHPEYEAALKGLGMDDCWEIDPEDLETIHQTLKGKDILPDSVKLVSKDVSWPTHFIFDNMEYSL
jgi:hypothetical protein